MSAVSYTPTEGGRCLTAPALMLRTAPCFTVAAVPVSIRIAGGGQ